MRTCPYCKKEFETKNGYENHILSYHEQEKSHQCNICRKRFKDGPTLQGHIERIHEGTKFACHMCDKDFVHPNTLKREALTLHQKKSKLDIKFYLIRI